jgi:murein DD-endopeptidase MepM/ murein hydrolase activator NlpD
MHEADRMKAELGNEPPLLVDGRGGPPDKREISARWLSGTFLTGVTSSILLGVALFAALDGREQLATPPEIANLSEMAPSREEGGDIAKSERVLRPSLVTRARDRRRMEVSTVIRSGDRELVRSLPFVHVRMALAAGHTTDRKYPDFNPLEVFSAEGEEIAATTSMTIYGARVDSDVSLKTVDFPLQAARFDEKGSLSAEEVEEVVRATASILTDGAVQVAALHYVDPQRFGASLLSDSLPSALTARIVPQNVSVALPGAFDDDAPQFSEEVIPVRRDSRIVDIFERSGYVGEDAAAMADALATVLRSKELEAGSAMRIGIERREGTGRIVRASVYDATDHRLTIALDDHDQYVQAEEPEVTELVASALEEEPPQIRTRGDLPSTYDGIYRAAFAYGLSKDMTRHLIKILAADVDFKARLNPSDQLELFFSQPDENGNATEESELLYVRAIFNGRERTLYRFQMGDGKVDYFTPEGRSARQFLLRNPMPNGRFASGFGMRRHPVLKYSRMHTGVDWSAPRGTPIIASGSGTVVSAGWAQGYGKQVVIRHANGYVTSYSHQSAIAKGVVPGAEIRQGQVIGYVGSTGLSTGNHLHYEVIVNGTKVDPMRVRLPTGKVLKGEELEAFSRERERIDALLQEGGEPPLKVASR